MKYARLPARSLTRLELHYTLHIFPGESGPSSATQISPVGGYLHINHSQDHQKGREKQEHISEPFQSRNSFISLVFLSWSPPPPLPTLSPGWVRQMKILCWEPQIEMNKSKESIDGGRDRLMDFRRPTCPPNSTRPNPNHSPNIIMTSPKGVSMWVTFTLLFLGSSWF